jgi:U3 small nucleolar RNA-associated protein 13
MPVEVNSA